MATIDCLLQGSPSIVKSTCGTTDVSVIYICKLTNLMINNFKIRISDKL